MAPGSGCLLITHAPPLALALVRESALPPRRDSQFLQSRWAARDGSGLHVLATYPASVLRTGPLARPSLEPLRLLRLYFPGEACVPSSPVWIDCPVFFLFRIARQCSCVLDWPLSHLKGAAAPRPPGALPLVSAFVSPGMEVGGGLSAWLLGLTLRVTLNIGCLQRITNLSLASSPVFPV